MPDDLLAYEDVLRTSTGVAFHTATPHEATATSERRRTSILVVAASATQRVATGLTETTHLAGARPTPQTSPTARGRTVVRRPIDVDQLLLRDPPSVLSLPLPTPSSTSPPAAAAGARVVAVRRPDERRPVPVERGQQGGVVAKQQAVADGTEGGQLTPAGLERTAS